MKVVKCASCAAPFDEVPEDTAVRCAFCGALNEPTYYVRPSSRPEEPEGEAGEPIAVEVQPIVLDLRAARPALSAAARFVTFVVFAIVLVSFGAAAWGVWVGLRAAFPHQVPPAPGETRWTLTNLGDFRDRGRRPLEVPAPAGGFQRFDPVAEIPWATRIARAWSKDARLERIDASHIRPDGTLDLAADPEAEVMYRFVSPSRIADYWRQADVTSDVRAEHEFWVMAARGLTQGQLLTSRPPSRDAPPPSPEVLTLAKTMERSRRARPERPFYKGYMIHSGGEGWVWYLSTLSGRENVPRVRARDGRAWPYR
jgi:hypothetical protein